MPRAKIPEPYVFYDTILYYLPKHSVSEILESPEVIAMRKISRHPNILYMVESHYDPLPGKVTLIFELMDMSLYDLMKARKGRSLTEQRVKIYLYQLLKGLEHLHKHGIFHRDIKPENILLKGDVVKLADLGSIRGIYSRPPYTEYISTRWYRSPECLLTTGFYGPKMDVWATGCVFYELLTLKPLFPGSNEVDQITKIHTILGTPHARLVAKFRRHKSRNCEYFFPTKGGTGVANLLPQVTDLGRDILKLMLVYDPENRSNVKRLLEHRYFNDLRENESPRHSTISVTPRTSSHEQGTNCQWRNPVLLSYITSERRRKSKPSAPLKSCGSKPIQLQMQSADLNPDNSRAKVPRVVASSPNYAGAPMPKNLYSKKSNATKISKSDKSNDYSSLDFKDSKKKLSRAWGTPNIVCPRKRENSVKIGERVSIKDNISDVSDVSGSKLPSIKKSSSKNIILSRENIAAPIQLRTVPTKRGPSTLGTQYNNIRTGKLPSDQSFEQKYHCEHRGRNFLPVIVSQKPDNFLVHRGSGGAFSIRVAGSGSGSMTQAYCDSKILLCGAGNNNNNNGGNNCRQKTRLATITERTTPADVTITRTIPNSYIATGSSRIAVKSPAKKMAKHEIESTSLSPTPSTVIPSKKIKSSPKKFYEKRERFGNAKY